MHQHSKSRPISNGGLGGLITPAQIDDLNLTTSASSTWPRSRKKRPPPLQIIYDNNTLLVPAPQQSAILFTDENWAWTPSTPHSWDYDRELLRSKTACAPPLSQYNPFFHQASRRIHGDEQNDTSNPVELPGSLLLPSQGFLQTSDPPVTPPRPIFPPRRGTGDSDISSAPGLSTSSSLTSEDIETSESYFIPIPDHPKSEETEFVDLYYASEDSLTDNQTTEQYETAQIHCISELEADIEDLLLDLINMPQPDKIRSFIQNFPRGKANQKKAVETVENNTEAFESDTVPSADNQAMDQETVELKMRTDLAKAQEDSRRALLKSKDTLIKVGSLEHIIAKKDRHIRDLEEMLSDASASFQSFKDIQIRKRSATNSTAKANEILQVIAGYADDEEEHYVEEMISSKARGKMRESDVITKSENRKMLKEYLDVILEQDEIIKAQSQQLDENLSKYEKCMQKLKNREREVVNLTENHQALRRKIRLCEEGFRHFVKHGSFDLKPAVLDTSISKVLNRMKSLHKQQIESKNLEIAKLRQKLGSAREEVLARRADIQNVIRQKQAPPIPIPPTQEETTTKSLAAKTRNLLSWDKDKSKKPKLPTTKSSISLGLAPVGFDLLTTHDVGYSSKEVIAASQTNLAAISASNSSTSTIRPRRRRASDSGAEFKRNAGSSLLVTDEGHQSPVLAAPRLNRQKDLPKPPSHSLKPSKQSRRPPLQFASPTHLRPPMQLTQSPMQFMKSPAQRSRPLMPPALPRLNTRFNQQLSPHNSPRLRTPQSARCSPLSASRRVLSLIPETSHEDEIAENDRNENSNAHELYQYRMNSSTTDAGAKSLSSGIGSENKKHADTAMQSKAENKNMPRAMSEMHLAHLGQDKI